MSIETSFFSSKAPKERKVCIAKWHRGWNGPRAERFAPSDPKAVDWKAAYRKELESRFPTPSSLRLYLQEIEKRTPDPILLLRAEPGRVPSQGARRIHQGKHQPRRSRVERTAA